MTRPLPELAVAGTASAPTASAATSSVVPAGHCWRLASQRTRPCPHPRSDLAVLGPHRCL